jgi:hypothetical protein
MNHRQKQFATATLIAVFATGLLPEGAWAADASEVQELRQEVRQLRADLQTLTAAVAETTELERQRSANLSRAMKEQSAPSQPPAPAREVASNAGETTPAPAPSVTRDDQGGKKSSRRRRHRRAPRSGSKKASRWHAVASDR